MLPPQLVCWHMATQLSLLAFRVGIIFPEIFQRHSPFSVFQFHQSQCSWGNWAAGEREPDWCACTLNTIIAYVCLPGLLSSLGRLAELNAYVFVVKRWIRFKDSLQMGKWWEMIFWLVSCAIGNELRNLLLSCLDPFLNYGCVPLLQPSWRREGCPTKKPMLVSSAMSIS